MSRRKWIVLSLFGLTVTFLGGITYVWMNDLPRAVAEVDVSDEMACVVLSPEGRFVALGESNGRISVLRSSDLRCIDVRSREWGEVDALGFTPDENTIFAALQGGDILIWSNTSKSTIENLTRRS